MEDLGNPVISRMFMHKEKIDIWIPEEILASMTAEANKKFPKETGGSLMGYFSRKKTVVVTDLVGPGPKAQHNRYSFIPDYKFQEKQIAQIYDESNRFHTYLGDWHTHPGGSATLSGTDARALENIADYPKARAPLPIMVLLAGGPDPWNTKAWQLRSKSLLKIVFTRRLVELDKNLY